jgi:type II secretory pathway predicted ATPase ExeA
MTHLAHIQRAFDPATPPEGRRLVISTVAARLKVSTRQMAEACGMSGTSLFTLTSENRWPARMRDEERQAVRDALAALLAKAGASEDELRCLWHAHVAKQGAHAAPAPGPKPTTPPEPPAAAPAEPKETDVLLPKQSLSMAARKAFQLFTNPFDSEVQSEEAMFVNNEIAFAREMCWQTATAGRFMALVSESGGGKTTILQDLEARIARDRKQQIVIRPSVLGMEDTDTKGKTLKATDILAAVITTLDPLATVPQTLEARSKKMARLLAASIEAGYQHLLVIEEAHCLPDATLKHLKRLHELHVGRKPMLGILLVAQPELGMKLDPKRASLREVTQRCEVVQLMPLDGDLKAYLEHRCQAAGRKLEELFDERAIEALRARLTVEKPSAGGRRAVSLLYPLAVNNLATAALNVAAELGAPKVTSDVVRAV